MVWNCMMELRNYMELGGLTPGWYFNDQLNKQRTPRSRKWSWVVDWARPIRRGCRCDVGAAALLPPFETGTPSNVTPVFPVLHLATTCSCGGLESEG